MIDILHPHIGDGTVRVSFEAIRCISNTDMSLILAVGHGHIDLHQRDQAIL